MTNINITTTPTGRSPENKYFFGESTNELCTKRPKYYKTGDPYEYNQFAARMKPTYVNSINYEFSLFFETCGIRFCVYTNDNRHGSAPARGGPCVSRVKLLLGRAAVPTKNGTATHVWLGTPK